MRYRSFALSGVFFALGLVSGIASHIFYIRDVLLCSVADAFLISTGLFVIPAALMFTAWLWFRLRRQSPQLVTPRLCLAFLLGVVHVAILLLVQTQILERLSYSIVSRCAEWITTAFAYCTILYAEIMRRYGFRAEPTDRQVFSDSAPKSVPNCYARDKIQMWGCVRVKLIIGWLYTVILCLIYGLLLSAYGFLLRFPDPFDAQKSSFVLLLFVLALLAVFIGCCFGVSWLCRKRNLDSRGYWRLALLVLLTIPVACLMHDASPIEHDYSLQDIVSTDQEVLKSYDTLMLFRKGGSIKVETTDPSSTYPQFQTNILANYLTNTLAYSESISYAWNSIAAARTVIEKLDTYPGIADLTPQVQLGTNTPIPYFVTLRSVSWAYAAYANLKTAEGHPDEGVQHLAKIQSVTRKTLPYSAILIDKMVWITIARKNIEAAFAIMQQMQCTHETIAVLKKNFPPSPKTTFLYTVCLLGNTYGSRQHVMIG